MTRPLSSSSGAPRNLLMTKPQISAWSSGESRASVPYMAANTPPRSMSPVTMTGRPARALADDHVVGVPQPGQAVQGDLPQPRRVRAVPHRVGFGLEVAQYDDLAAAVTARLEQHGVHVGGRLDAGRGRLHGLSPADLGAVQGHERVQRHVLR